MNHINQFVLMSSSHSNYILLYILCNTNWPNSVRLYWLSLRCDM